MENNTNLSPQESLAIIETMISRAQNRFTENGHLYLMWGWTVFICSITHFLCIQFGWFTHPEIVWSLTWLTVIYQIVFLTKKKKKETVKTYADEVKSYVWVAFGIMMFLTVFLMSKNDVFDKMYPMFLVLYGMPTFLSGVILRFPALKFGGIVCWILAAIASFMDWKYQLPFLALAVFAAWIIPGYLLRKKYLSDNNN